MIEKYELSILLEKYGINPKKIVDKNENILTYGEYIDINNTLDYLVNELKINIIYIEKCPSIMYLNVNSIKSNVKFLKKNKIRFSSVENCLHVLSTTPEQLEETYEYVERKYGVNAIEKITSILSVPKDKIIDIENLNIPNINKDDILSIAVGVNDIKEIIKIIQSKEFKDYPELFTSTVLAHAKLEDIIKIINSEEFKKHPELFTSTVLAYAKLEDIIKIINSEEFKKHPELFTSTVLAYAKLEDIIKIINSEEFKKHPELFTSTVLASAKLEDIIKIINSKEFKKHPELFTSQVLAYAKLEDIIKIINSEEFKKHPELFTSEVLAHAKLEDIIKIINSEEFRKYPELFTSEVLARAKLEDIIKIINSKEFKDYPKLFTSEVLARAKLEDIIKIINSKEFKDYPELFTSTVLANAKLEDIKTLLNLPYFKEEKYKHLLTSSLLAKAKTVIKKLPILFEIAMNFEIEDYITTNYLLKSPSQNYAIISYLNDNNLPFVVDGKLNTIFSYQPGVLKKKYNIDLKEIMEMYPLPLKYKEGVKVK